MAYVTLVKEGNVCIKNKFLVNMNCNIASSKIGEFLSIYMYIYLPDLADMLYACIYIHMFWCNGLADPGFL